MLQGLPSYRDDITRHLLCSMSCMRVHLPNLEVNSVRNVKFFGKRSQVFLLSDPSPTIAILPLILLIENALIA